ncbi:glycosyltransferase family 39 protein [Sphingomicrobium aestuariivivum]|uniref:glycosyltransferase family 39 protein n=1 Tax=Sphingomicrobium aestuariivivum TaxID=1582356 RepID=UPI001FD69659|nr:glycosyltransferase family 39 protein [Sphingomicrobium aestuariivivum]MCJ8191824.1 glycosyltransferase family 39 protein [Sphingomicrobium aestuariivivum]
MLAFFALLAFILIVNPVGYIGGAWDDWQYLNAARCWVENGPCLPGDHWQGRWPVIAPLALSTGLLGESRFAVGLPYLLAFLALCFLITRIGNRLAGPPIGWMVATLLLAIPAATIKMYQPSVEPIELALLAGSTLALLHYGDRHDARPILLSGLLLGLAFQVRETALLAALPLALGALALKAPVRHIALAVTAFLLPLLVEMLVFGLQTGDPFHRRALSLGHTAVPSTELRGEVAEGPPLFNSQLIANWRHVPGFRVHWLVDGPLNLFLNGAGGLTLLLNLFILPLAWKRLTGHDRSVIKWTTLVGLYFLFGLVYALAIDPKPRMLLVPLLCSSLIFAIQVRALWRGGVRLAAATVVASVLLAGAFGIAVQREIRSIEPAIAKAIADHPGKIETDAETRRHLALVEGADRLLPLSSDAPELIVKVDIDCALWSERLLGGKLEVVRVYPMGLVKRLPGELASNICHYRYREPVSELTVSNAKDRPRDDYDPSRGFRMIRKRLRQGD